MILPTLSLILETWFTLSASLSAICLITPPLLPSPRPRLRAFWSSPSLVHCGWVLRAVNARDQEREFRIHRDHAAKEKNKRIGPARSSLYYLVCLPLSHLAPIELH